MVENSKLAAKLKVVEKRLKEIDKFSAKNA